MSSDTDEYCFVVEIYHEEPESVGGEIAAELPALTGNLESEPTEP